MALRGHMLDVLLAFVAALGLAIVLSVEDATAMDMPPVAPVEAQVLEP